MLGKENVWTKAYCKRTRSKYWEPEDLSKRMGTEGSRKGDEVIY